ncbi:MAG: hypothetical protein LBG06_08195 [Deltaproteobacteria bacterium]|jgi:hypothetical protein|nr:hypothetical protein [Deltaproteobacteria bacterium]
MEKLATREELRSLEQSLPATREIQKGGNSLERRLDDTRAALRDEKLRLERSWTTLGTPSTRDSMKRLRPTDGFSGS